jgi:hypothetical protein
MRYLTILIAVLLTACASTASTSNNVNLKTANNNSEPQTYRVLGTGKTFEDAKQNGFKLAIEFTVGSIILSEKESKNDSLIKDDIFSYSAGYINSFKILSQTQLPTGFTLAMDVSVSNSRIAERIISTKEGKNLDGSTVYDRYESFLKNRQNQDKLFDIVLESYPQKAFDLRVDKVDFSVNGNRELFLDLKYSVRDNQNYYASLSEVISIVADRNNGANAIVKVFRNPKNKFMKTVDQYYMNDSILIEKLDRKLGGINYHEGGAMLLIQIKDSLNNVLYSDCSEKFLSLRVDSGYHLIDGTGSEWGEVNKQIKVNPKMLTLMKSFDKVELTMLSDARKYRALCQVNN